MASSKKKPQMSKREQKRMRVQQIIVIAFSAVIILAFILQVLAPAF